MATRNLANGAVNSNRDQRRWCGKQVLVMGMVVLDHRGVIVAADAGAAAVFGWASAELIGKRAIDLIPERERTAYAEAVAKYLEAPVERTIGRRGREANILRKDGTVLGVGVRLVPLAGPTGLIAAFGIDLDREEDAVGRKRSEEHLRAAQQITHCGSWELDLTDLANVNKNPLRWSDEVFRIFGYEPGAIEVTNDNFFAAVHPDDRERIGAAVRDAIDSGTMYSIDHRVIRPDGTIRFVHEQSEIMRDPDGRPILMIGTVQDITERRTAEEALRRAEQAAVLADRMASVGVVAAGVAHEINNPLAAVMMSLDLLATRLTAQALAEPGPAATDMVDTLEDARLGLDRVREIVRDLRVFARGDNDRRGPVDVERVLESTLRMAASQIRARARLVRRYSALPPVIATEARLGQVFLNILLNAAQAIPEGAPELHEIRITTELDAEGRIAVTIADTGAGIPLEIQPKIFTPFFTTKEVGAGTGLGLSICHRILTGLGGEIEFESTPRRGTEFRVLLPPAPVAPRPERPTPDPDGPAARRARILVVDDEPLVRTALVQLLADRHEVIALDAAGAALAAIEKGDRYDVILCDLMMPQMTGMELHAALARVAPDQARRLVAMTGGAFSAQAREFLAAGHPSVEKPFDVPVLTAVIDRLVAGLAVAAPRT
jgi:PAS domain S-box-containing protein